MTAPSGTYTVRVDIDLDLHGRLRKLCENQPFGQQSHLLRQAIRRVVENEETKREERARIVLSDDDT